MNRKQRKSSRIRMLARSRRASSSPTIVFAPEVDLHPFACNRAAKRLMEATGQLHTPVDMPPLRKAGEDHDGQAIYFMGEERFIPAYCGKSR